MVKLELTPLQASELRKHYIEELDRLQKRSTEILTLLKAIGHDPADFESPVSKATTAADKEEEGKKVEAPGWSEYIIKLLSERKRAVSRIQIFNSYQNEYNIDFPDPKAAKNTLSQALHYLTNVKKLIVGSARKGKHGHVYKLVENRKESIEEKQKTKKLLKEVKEVKRKTDSEEKNPPKYKKVKSEISDEDVPEEKYMNLIVAALSGEKRILNRNEFLDYAMTTFNEPPKRKISTRGKLIKALSYMTKETGQLKKTNKPGETGTYFGLAEWFD